jgi:hypothetical protein
MAERMLQCEVPVAAIDRDYNCFPRERIHSDRVAEFADLYADGGLDALPPVVVVDAGDGRLIRSDGEHRLCALEQLGREKAHVQVIASDGGDPVQVAYRAALERAAISAWPLSRAERRTAVLRLIEDHPNMPDREIGRLVGVSHQTVGRLRHGGPLDQPAASPRAVSPEQAARKLLRSFEKLRQARGLGFLDWLGGGDRTGERFASALQDVFGEEAAEQARLFSGWLGEAAGLLEAHEEGD